MNDDHQHARAGGALLVVGGNSGAGKSTVTAGLCRAWARNGRDVVPFKAQNMSNHSAVTPDGGEIGRAQAMQALAARLDTDRRMNPILLKPTRAATSHVVVLGDEVGTTDARGYAQTAQGLKPVVLEALNGLRRDHAWLVAEGAGGAAEINLFDRDLVNLPLAAAAGIPALLVVDIDRGGAFATAHGTIDLLPEHLRRQVGGIVFNQFRGDPSLLDSGIAALQRRTAVPVLGVLPHLGDHPMLGVEDSLDVGHSPQRRGDAARPVRVAVIRLPHLSNPSDFDPLVMEPDVDLRWATQPGDLADADLVILPGSRATVADLQWVRDRGLDDALRHSGARVLGLCAGYQMLGRRIHDDVESRVGTVDGLGLLDVETTFESPKVVSRAAGHAAGTPVAGYQIRWGRPRGAAQPWLELDDGPEGARDASGDVCGTSLHGVLDGDDFRCGLLADVAAARGRSFTPASVSYAAALEDHLEHLADWVERYVDIDALDALAATAAAPGAGPGWT
ncbi:MAG: cobyric acid synthase [Ornithinimicrobium sp.]